MKLHLGKTSNQNGGFNVCLCILIIDPGRLRTWESKPTNFQIGKNPMNGSGWSYSNNEFLASMWATFSFSRHHHIWFYICVKDTSQPISPFLPTNHLFATDLQHTKRSRRNGPIAFGKETQKSIGKKRGAPFRKRMDTRGLGENQWLWCLGDLGWFREVW